MPQVDVKAYLADDVTVVELARWINHEHKNAALEQPPNMDYMRAMQRLSEGVESALGSYRHANETPAASADR